MEPFDQLSDDAVLAQIGARLSFVRLSHDMTQAQLAHNAGVSKRTVERIEAGRSVQLTSFIRILRALGSLAGMELFLPPPQPGPMDLLRRGGRTPQRATGTDDRQGEPWTWADKS